MKRAAGSASTDRVPLAVVSCVAALAAAVALQSVLPAALPVAVAACVAALASLVLLRRRTQILALALGALGAGTALLLAGALPLAGRPRGGFIYVVGVVFVLFLPVAPWLYAATWSKREGDGDHGGDHAAEPGDGA